MGRRKLIEDEDLLAIAREVFTETGGTAPTREIARRAGVSEAVLFQRYGTKETLFFAAMSPQPPDIEAIMAAGEGTADPCHALQEISLEIVRYFRGIIPMSMRLMTHPSFDMQKLGGSGSVFERGLVKRLAAFLAARRDEGKVRTEEPETAAGLLIAALHSVASFEALGVHGDPMPDGAVRGMVVALWHGLSPAATTSGAGRRLHPR